MDLDLILKDISDIRVRENFFRIQKALGASEILSPDLKFYDIVIENPSTSYPIPHGLKYTPRDVIPLYVEGNYNYCFLNSSFDDTNIYVSAKGPVRLRFLAGKFSDYGPAKNQNVLTYVAPGAVTSQGLSGSGSDGWAFIQDGQYTSSKPMSVVAGTRTLLTNDATGALTNYANAPANASSWWDNVNSKFWPSKPGEFYTFKLNCVIVPAVNNKTVTLDSDIGTGNLPYQSSEYLAQGAGVPTKISIAIPMPIGTGAFSNGVNFHVTCDANIQVYGINLTIIRDYHL